jgi:hypothetical protein
VRFPFPFFAGTGQAVSIMGFMEDSRIHCSGFKEALMRILVTGVGLLRLVMACIVIGIVLGVYFGVAEVPDSVPPSVDSVAPVNATAQ